ncbi:polyketide synthase dehydratase domain-containing protein, partial [Nocardia sp. NPDC088792]|uniref:polyketide synthase dehydratase domain-containing protein n=1 Tax=Nocardia sp. NPDC088792 TaxID=3364332 RepID=UPI0037F8176C
MATSDTILITARLSLQTAPWLADHAVHGTVVFPGTGFLELAIHAADFAEAGALAELVVHTPLVFPVDGYIQLQVAMTRENIEVYARPGHDDPWALHATATTCRDALTVAPLSADWPPAGSTALDIGDFYHDLAGSGFEYGPVFQGLTAAWQQNGHVYAEITLPEVERDAAADYGIHPALLDAALHPAAFAALEPTEHGFLPFSFTDVTLHASGATAVRVRLTRTGPSSVSVLIVDQDGFPVLSIGELVLRPLTPQTLSGTPLPGAMLAVTWTDIPPMDTAGQPVDFTVVTDHLTEAPPGVLVLDIATDPTDVLRSVHATVANVLRTLQGCTGDRIVVVTRGAIAKAPDLAAAAIWGFVRSAQTEDPDRFVLLDLELGVELNAKLLAGSLATGEPQLIHREGTFRCPRLTRLPESDETLLNVIGTVLITGGTGGLGQVVARHLVARHGVRSLLLLSR